MKWIPYGPNAWLLRFAERLGEEAFLRGQAITRELEQHPPPGLAEFVPSFTTVLLEFRPGAVVDASTMQRELTARFSAAVRHPPVPPEVREIPVVYDGPDLERVARLHRLSTDDVTRLHCDTIYKVYLLGFSPGFPYLGDLDPRLHTPRLPSPRLRVAAGSVAIGGEHTGIYTVDSPGGWNIIGRTAVRLFDPHRAEQSGRREDMFWLKAGDRVRFVPQPSP